MALELAAQASSSDEQSRAFSAPAVVPIPDAAVLSSLGNGYVPLDTWVELSFEDAVTGATQNVKRTLTRGPQGRVVETVTNLDGLGIDPVSLHVGITMPALIPFIRLNEASDLGKAVAAMTGFSPLRDLDVYVGRSIDKLRIDLPRDKRSELTLLDGQYRQTRTELQTLLSHHPEIGSLDSVPESLSAEGLEAELRDLRAAFEGQYSQLFEGAKAVLGPDFDPQHGPSTSSLARDVGPAIGLLDVEHLRALPSISRMAAIASSTQQEAERLRTVIGEVVSEAPSLGSAMASPEVGRRVRLYHRVGGWMREEGMASVDNCPVCGHSLESSNDGAMGRPVKAILTECAEADRTYLAHSIDTWATEVKGRLRAAIRPELASEVGGVLPATPAELLKKGLVDELFAQQRFQGTLSLLKAGTELALAAAVEHLPLFVEPEAPELPQTIKDAAPALVETLKGAVRLHQFMIWRREHEIAWKAAIEAVLGTRSAPSTTSLRSRLNSLNSLVSQGTPLREATAKVEASQRLLQQRSQKLLRMDRYAAGALALEELRPVAALGEAQVLALITQLSSATAEWKGCIYSPAFTGAPRTQAANVSTDGRVSARATSGGTSAPAEQVSNTSDLRATLFAFLFAFWHEMFARRGGLATILLDDVQEHFDEANRRRVATAFPKLLELGAQVVATTSERSFRIHTVRACRTRSPDSIDCRRVHPLNGHRRTIQLIHLMEVVEERRQSFESPENEDVAQPARDYLNELRIFLEENLMDLFAVADDALPESPTLSDLIGAIRRRVNAGQDMFITQPYRALVADVSLRPGSEFLRLMNESHHQRAHLITFSEVWAVRSDCDRVCELVTAVHEAYERWLRRDPAEPRPSMPSAPVQLPAPNRAVPVYSIAALSRGEVPTESDSGGDAMDLSALTQHAIYYLRTGNFGFSAPADSCVLVDVRELDVPDGRLVIALYRERIFARRLLRHPSRRDVVMLASEAADPRFRPPTVVLPTAEVRLLPVVGVLLHPAQHFGRPTSNEAVLLSDSSVLDRVRIAFRVEGESALPLALPAQIILGSEQLTEAQVSVEGQLIAASTSEGAVFKRTGRPLPGFPHARSLESVGGLGDSLVIRLTNRERDPLASVPVLHVAYRIEGVLYHELPAAR